jgi:ATP-dependent exoDNAse (exonuclease V) beta subunit
VSCRTPTPEQKAAIVATQGEVLLEAGAGTGKTGVMVDRYCRLVCDQGASPDAILAFTFTDKAAAELRHRIRAELARRAESGSERAAALLTGLGAAWVTTIHGFCNRLLAGHPVAAGVDPGFRVLDAAEAERAAREAFEAALEEFLSTRDEGREETIASFEIDGLRATVVGAHAELRSRGIARPRLPEQAEPDVAAAVLRAAAAAEACLAELKEGDGRRELLERAAASLGQSPAGLLDLDALTTLRTESRAKNLTAYREAIEAAIARTAEAGVGGEAYRHIATLIDLFSARFEAAKERRTGIDFEDLQILAARLLERSEIGQAYRSRFSHLMVDEFQDTNRLQLRLIEALHGPGSKLMVVGDEFQSIYGFRHADLEVFRERRRLVAANPDGAAMALSGNFRSRPEVVGAVNALGAELLGDSFRPLRVGIEPPRPAPAGEGPAVELLLTARDGWDGEGIELAPPTDGTTPPNCLAEARLLAKRLRELAEGGINRGEMVLLLRAFTHLDAYEDSLERAGLRPYVVGGRGYWSQQQVSDVCALLATIANPLDDQALFGALASPACGLAPDTLWLLRAAAGKRRHVWPAIEAACDLGEPEPTEPERLAQIPAQELALLQSFAATVEALRERGTRLSLEGLIDAAVTETGYDLAVLMRPSGEARFANVRKLMRLAAEFESREGRDLRGLLDFLASRAEVDAEAQAATAVEGHDGVRIMTVHNAKGLEFGVVAVPDLSRSLLAGSRPPLLTIGREGEEPRVGMQLRRLGAPSINLFSYAELCEEAKERDAEEGLRLFYVAATRAQERLILSGVIKPEGGSEPKTSTPVIERIVDGLGVDREADSTLAVPAPEARDGLAALFQPSAIAVRVNLPSPERAAELTVSRREAGAGRSPGEGPAPLLTRRPPAAPSRPLSYTAISAYEECGYRFYAERVLGLGERVRGSSRIAGTSANSASGKGAASPSAREERTAQGAAVHALLEWSQANEWQEPVESLVARHAVLAGLDPDATPPASLLEPLRGWLGSSLLRDRVRDADATVRAEVPLLLGLGGTVLRGSIDLLVEREGEVPLVIDYKTDRLDSSSPVEQAGRYRNQRAIYALAAAEARGVTEVEVAYVFLERPEMPVLDRLGAAEMESERERLAAAIARIGGGEFPAAAIAERSWSLCRGCPALGRMCSGPAEAG